MWVEIFNWASSHSTLITVVVGFLCLICPSPIKFQGFGFTVSQYCRKLLGKKGEEKFEEIADSFVKGLHSDNEIKK